MDYLKLVEFYEKLDSTTKRLEKTYIVSELLKETKLDDLKQVIYLLQGRVFPAYDPRELGVATRLIIKAIAQSTGSSVEHIEKIWRDKGDLGLVSEKLTVNKKQTTLFSQKLTVHKVFSNLESLSTLEGQGTVSRKVSLISELLTSATSLESKYIIRTVLGQLRIGTAEGILRDAIAWSYYPKVLGVFEKCNSCNKIVPKTEKCMNCNKSLSDNKDEKTKIKNSLEVTSLEELKKLKNKIKDYDYIVTNDEKLSRDIYNYFMSEVQEYYDRCNDFAQVAEALVSNSEIKIKLVIGTPINPMLAVKVETFDESFESLGSKVLAEYKLDGFRLQIHKDKNKFWFFTRRLDNVLNQFKELIPIINENVDGDSFILDCEVVGYDPKTKKYKAFQDISQRIKRKYHIEKTAKEIPVEINVFDVLYYNGKSMIDDNQLKRHELINKIIKKVPGKIVTAKSLVTESEDEIKSFYKESLKNGNEGIMLKSIDKRYTPGRRVGGWIKFKPSLEPLDLVIVGATLGEGKRSMYLSSYNLACKSGSKFLECGMSSSGLKEKSKEGFSYDDMTKMLEPLIIKKKDRNVFVRPKIIVEIIYEEIQKSPTYESGFALRFPRIKNIREDKPLKDISTIEDIKRIYEKQRGRNNRGKF